MKPEQRKTLDTVITQALADDLATHLAKHGTKLTHTSFHTQYSCAYCRVDFRYGYYLTPTGSLEPTLVLAFIEVPERFQRQGIFKHVLSHVEAIAHSWSLHLMVENTMGNLQDYLPARGYIDFTPDRKHGSAPCYWKL